MSDDEKRETFAHVAQCMLLTALLLGLGLGLLLHVVGDMMLCWGGQCR